MKRGDCRWSMLLFARPFGVSLTYSLIKPWLAQEPVERDQDAKPATCARPCLRTTWLACLLHSTLPRPALSLAPTRPNPLAFAYVSSVGATQTFSLNRMKPTKSRRLLGSHSTLIPCIGSKPCSQAASGSVMSLQDSANSTWDERPACLRAALCWSVSFMFGSENGLFLGGFPWVQRPSVCFHAVRLSKIGGVPSLRVSSLGPLCVARHAISLPRAGESDRRISIPWLDGFPAALKSTNANQDTPSRYSR